MLVKMLIFALTFILVSCYGEYWSEYEQPKDCVINGKTIYGLYEHDRYCCKDSLDAYYRAQKASDSVEKYYVERLCKYEDSIYFFSYNVYTGGAYMSLTDSRQQTVFESVKRGDVRRRYGSLANFFVAGDFFSDTVYVDADGISYSCVALNEKPISALSNVSTCGGEFYSKMKEFLNDPCVDEKKACVINGETVKGLYEHDRYCRWDSLDVYYRAQIESDSVERYYVERLCKYEDSVYFFSYNAHTGGAYMSLTDSRRQSILEYVKRGSVRRSYGSRADLYVAGDFFSDTVYVDTDVMSYTCASLNEELVGVLSNDTACGGRFYLKIKEFFEDPCGDERKACVINGKTVKGLYEHDRYCQKDSLYVYYRAQRESDSVGMYYVERICENKDSMYVFSYNVHTGGAYLSLTDSRQQKVFESVRRGRVRRSYGLSADFFVAGNFFSDTVYVDTDVMSYPCVTLNEEPIGILLNDTTCGDNFYLKMKEFFENPCAD